MVITLNVCRPVLLILAIGLAAGLPFDLAPSQDDARDRIASESQGLLDVYRSLHRILGGGMHDNHPSPFPSVSEFVQRAGWEGVDLDAVDRSPVMFIPPFSGIRIVQKLTNKPIRSVVDLLCPRNTNGKWVPAWLPASPGKLDVFCSIRNLPFGGKDKPVGSGEESRPNGRLLVETRGRFASARMRVGSLVLGEGEPMAEKEDPAWYPPMEGVESTFEDSFDATQYLDFSGVWAPIFGPWVKAMVVSGWKAGYDVDALRYDWRKGPDSYMAAGGASQLSAP